MRRAALVTCVTLIGVGLLIAGRDPRLPNMLGRPAARATPDRTLIRGPYLQAATTESITIVWRTYGPSEPSVRYGTPLEFAEGTEKRSDPQQIVVRVGPDVVANGEPPRLHSAPADTWQYEATLTGLNPATRYSYTIHDGDRKLAGGETYHFTTHPRTGEPAPVRMWVVGDSGMGNDDQIAVHRAMQDHLSKDGRPLNMYLHVGDMVYPGGEDANFQTKFFDIYDAVLRITVCWPAFGNHEGKYSKGKTGLGPYFDAYVIPRRADTAAAPPDALRESFYSFDYGQIHVISLNSFDLDRKASAPMAKWLAGDLASLPADCQWLIAFWHHPAYTKGSHDSDREKELVEMRQNIVPMLEAAGVDLILTGHSHIYERSMLIDGAYATPTVATGVVLNDGEGDGLADTGPYRKSAGLHPHEGHVHVVAGHGGAKLRRAGTSPVMRKVVVEHGSLLVDITGDTLQGTMVNRDGNVRDRFQIVKRGTVPRTVVEKPAQLPKFVPNKS